MSQNYKRKLIRRIEKLLSKSKSPLLDMVTDFGISNPKTGEVDLEKTFVAIVNQIPLYGITLKGAPFDLGSYPGYYYYQPRIWGLLKTVV